MMKEILENLWNEYFAEECAVIDTDEERAFLVRTGELHESVNELLTKEQRETIEKYIEALYEMQNLFVKKAFFKGCEFATTFLFEAGKFAKK